MFYNVLYASSTYTCQHMCKLIFCIGNNLRIVWILTGGSKRGDLKKLKPLKFPQFDEVTELFSWENNSTKLQYFGTTFKHISQVLT